MDAGPLPPVERLSLSGAFENIAVFATDNSLKRQGKQCRWYVDRVIIGEAKIHSTCSGGHPTGTSELF